MIKDLVRKSRSYRGYDESYQISREKLVELIDCARLAPSSVNCQSLCYYLAWEKKDVEQIQSLTKWAALLPQMKLPHPGMYPTSFIVICQKMDIARKPFFTDVGVAAQTILLAATEEGLGGCMIGNFDSEALKAKLDLAENIMPLLILAIGKPNERIILTEIGEDGKTAYYRDKNDIHYVPKRKLEDIIL